MTTAGENVEMFDNRNELESLHAALEDDCQRMVKELNSVIELIAIMKTMSYEEIHEVLFKRWDEDGDGKNNDSSLSPELHI